MRADRTWPMAFNPTVSFAVKLHTKMCNKRELKPLSVAENFMSTVFRHTMMHLTLERLNPHVESNA